MLEEIVKEEIKIDIPEQLVDGENMAEPYTKAWWDIEKVRVNVDAERLKIEKIRGDLIPKVDHLSKISQIIELLFKTLESSDEMMANAWEGRNAIQILEGRKQERDALRNEIANETEKGME